jgi:two-component system, NtrC family, sensor histidine kinase HydH
MSSLPAKPLFLTAKPWENWHVMSPAWASFKSSKPNAAAIAAFILVLAIFSFLIPPEYIETHNILHHLFFLPFMLAGMIFGWRGAGKAVLLAAVVQAPSIVLHWSAWPLDAKDQIVELTVFGSAGLIAGMLADAERVQRKHVETTKLELERVHVELSQNIERMKRSERLSAAGRLAASLAHEIRNPLASISGAAGILKRGHASGSNANECLEILEKESQRLNQLLTNFLDFARPRLPRYQVVEPISLVESVASLARHASILRNVELVQQSPSHMEDIECDAEQLKQVLLNLIINAVQASDGGGKVSVRSSSLVDRLCIEVRDEGCGIPAEHQDRIFEPFFTTKESGTGLGLAIAATIIEQHGGTLSGTNNLERGMTFRLELPFQRPASDKVLS